ncbi:phage tail protein [Streptomyces sp. p1417]|uniref:Phage tail protein n=1 Tax=Streptomyces typhae TaxID=2681492 RepID=A0A6L6WP50_9ACTN|nr:phage tail protein [Streptomyces typhae]MVO83873.1 phage tail protein [Streptomyces typhae]
MPATPNNGGQIRVAGTGRVLIAPVSFVPSGATDPSPVPTPRTTADTWPETHWQDLGYTTTDGIKFNKKEKIDPVETWQSGTPARFIYSDRDLTVKFQLLQMNKQTLAFFMGIPAAEIKQTKDGSVPPKDVADTFEFQLPSNPAKDERALGIEFKDGSDITYRFIIPRGQVTETEELGLTRTGALKLGVTFTALEGPNGELAKWIMKDKAYA